jgi:diguanylate cyclase (GGDEF)-like protein/PAS domain S-box-containing protein
MSASTPSSRPPAEQPSAFVPVAPGAPRSGLARRLAREWALLTAVWLVALGLTVFDRYRSRHFLIEADLSRLQSQSLAIEQNLVRQLEGVGNALASVRYRMVTGDVSAAAADRQALPAQLKLLADAMPGVRVMQVMDQNGNIVAASRGELVGRNFRERAYFRTASTTADGSMLHISPPFQSSLGTFTTVVSRAMLGDDGKLAGVVTASLDPDYFEIVLRSALYSADARATVAHGQGPIIVSSPNRDAIPGLNLDQPASMFRTHMQSKAMSSVHEGKLVGTGESRLLAMRTISPDTLRMDHPLVVRVSRSTSEVLQPWHTETRVDALLLLLGGGTAALWLYVHQRRRSALEQARKAVVVAERESARRLEFGLRGADLGLWEWDLKTDTVTVNAREMDMLGYPPATAPLAPDFWRTLTHPDEHEALKAVIKAHLQGKTPGYRIEHRYRHRDGHWVWVLDNAMVMERDHRGRPLRVVGTHLDISERKRSQFALERANAQLQALSLTDGLTGVANRRQFDQALAAEWTRAERQHHPLALLMIDVDHFKRYNDRLGHPAGDACLRTVAQVLSACLRQPMERLARYGGEEFAVLLLGVDEQVGAQVAQRCLQAVAGARLPHPDSPTGPYVSVSIGVAGVQPAPNEKPERLVQDADSALYSAKENGRGRYALASHQTAQTVLGRL